MASPKHGISNHLLLECFERTHKHLLKIGFSELDAYRGALAFSFVSSGEFTIDEAWEAADEIMSPDARREEPDAHRDANFQRQ